MWTSPQLQLNTCFRYVTPHRRGKGTHGGKGFARHSLRNLRLLRKSRNRKHLEKTGLAGPGSPLLFFVYVGVQILFVIGLADPVLAVFFVVE